MSEETAVNAHGSAPASTSSSPRTTIASSSRKNSGTGFFGSLEFSRGSKHKGNDRHNSGRFLHALAENSGNAEGYVSDQQPGTLSLPRYPGVGNAKPLSAHRIARIAHSFGVHAPLPHFTGHRQPSPFTDHRSFSAHSYSRHNLRQTTATRLLLHVIPPAGLIEGNELVTSGTTDDPLSRRGTLLPLHTTLQGQLQAIKREYNFPSTAGLILNLLDARDNEDAQDYIGPRLSEESWAVLWRPALKLDREEQQRSFTPKRPSSPPSPVSAEGASPDTDLLSPSSNGQLEPSSVPPALGGNLRPLLTSRNPLTSPSTTTLASTASLTSLDLSSAIPRSPSIFPPTPSSQLFQHHPLRSDSASNKSDTASITSSARRIIAPSPIVGKVEFDVDLQKGRWYDQWSARRRAQPPPILLSRRVLSTTGSVASTPDRISSPVEVVLEPRLSERSVDAPFDLTASISVSSVPSEPSPSLAARLELPSSPPFSSRGELTPAIDGAYPISNTEDGYAPLDDPTELDGDGYESQSGTESEYGQEAAQTAVIARHTGMQEDELAWRELQQDVEHADGQSRRRSARNTEFDVDLEGEIPEEDPISNGVNDATRDLEEVVAIWNERQGTIDSQTTQESVKSIQSSPTTSATTSEFASTAIVTILSSPSVLHDTTDNVEDGNTKDNADKYTMSPESVETPLLPVFPNKSNISRSIPPPLHLRPPSENTGVRVQILEASPSGSPEQGTASLIDVDGEGRSSFDSLAPTSPSGELLEVGDHGSVTSTSSSGDDELRSQIRLSQRLDTLEKHIAEVSPKLLPEEPEYQSTLDHRTPRELLERVAQTTPRFSAPPTPGTPQFFSNGFSRPTPGQPLILSPRNSPEMPVFTPSLGASTQWPTVPFDHVANEMRLNRTSPPSRPIPGSTPTSSRSQAASLNGDEDSSSRKSVAPSEMSLPAPSSDHVSSNRTSAANSVSPGHSSVADRPATPAVLDPPPRTVSLPQPSSRFSDDSFMSDAQTPEEPAPPTADTNPNPRISVKSFTRLFRSRSKSRDSRISREFAPPVPIPSPPIHSPRAVPPIPPPPPIPTQTQGGPPPRTPRAVSPIVGKSNNTRLGHTREDSGSDPFHFDQPVGRPTTSRSSSPSQEPAKVDPPTNARSSTMRGKRGILKGWGSSGRPSSSMRPVAPPPLKSQPQEGPGTMPPRSTTPQQLTELSRNASTASSLSARKMKMTHRESWVSVAENMVAGSSSSSTSLSSSGAPLAQPTEGLMAIDERESAGFAAGAQNRRETSSSLRPPVSPASTEFSQGPRPSVDEVSTPRTSQFEIVTPSPLPQQHKTTYSVADRI